MKSIEYYKNGILDGIRRLALETAMAVFFAVELTAMALGALAVYMTAKWALSPTLGTVLGVTFLAAELYLGRRRLCAPAQAPVYADGCGCEREGEEDARRPSSWTADDEKYWKTYVKSSKKRK